MIASARTCSIVVDHVLLGAIAPILGEADRWVAWSIHRKSVTEANEARFGDMHAAIDWLVDEHDRQSLQREAV